ncbi:response regulator [Defluviitalea saccharophila]|uniref:Stage 0 sporulation protein A homolog n=1 Tax=Defluviitalea saccharophila TaxID=879970 RepID=A0ABZ2Y8N4_9FIRM
MIKVVIADDEEKVCQLICSLIDWKALEMEIVGVAHNSIEALELIQSLQPDIMITDIRMPGYDGLELINRGKQIKNDIDFIIISGYSHFEYAQSAIKYGVSDYLLKPIKKNELLASLNKICEKQRLRTEQLTREERLKIRLQNDIDKLRSGFLTEILFKKATDQEELDMSKCNESYHFNFQSGCFQVFIIKMDCSYEDLFKSSIKIFENRISQIMRLFLKEECYDMEICFQNSRTYCLLNYDGDNKKRIRKQIKASLDELLVQNSIFNKIQFTIGLGIAVDNINDLRKSVITAEAAMEQRLIEGTNKLIENAPFQGNNTENDVLLSEFTKNMEAALEFLDPYGVLESIDYIQNKVLNNPNISGHELLNVVKEAFNIYLMLLRKHQFNVENQDILLDSFSLNIELCSSASQLFDHLKSIISDSVNSAIENRRQAYIKPIREAKQYIQQNYMKPITLKEVSNYVGFNDSYFSSLFKKECGINFLEYLSEVRMNKAKELLKETNLSVACICEAVGYNDLKHFIKLFKKYSGLKPNEFRKLYS